MIGALGVPEVGGGVSLACPAFAFRTPFTPVPEAMRTLLLATLLPLSGCANLGGGDCSADAYQQRLDRLRGQIEAEIGGAEATDPATCRTLPLGAKPCGGPWTYLVYSAQASDSTRLADLAAEYDRIDDERNRACELASDCMLVAPPAVDVVDGRCVAVEP